MCKSIGLLLDTHHVWATVSSAALFFQVTAIAVVDEVPILAAATTAISI
jgi:hypothetical protein